MPSKIVMTLTLLVICTSAPTAQEMTGALEGRVVDSLGVPIPGVTVAVNGNNLQGVRGTTSDAKGYFRVLALPVGSYNLKVSHVAYQQVSYENVPVRLGKTNSLGDLRLASQTVVLEPVTISGSRPLIDATTTTTGANITAKAFENLPTQRDLQSIVMLAPGTANSYYIGEGANISGGTGNENIYFIDGINVTEPVKSSTSTSLPYNFLREVEVKTGGYEPEYASAMGGIVNAVTQTGSNDLHGQAFGFFTNNGLTARRKTGLLGETVAGFTSYDAGLSLGGPIVTDRMWFYAAYNPTFEDQDITLPGLVTYPTQRRKHLFAGKLNWAAAENTQLVLSVLGDPSTYDGVFNYNPFNAKYMGSLTNPDPVLQRKENGGINVSLQAGQRVNDNILLEVLGSFFDRNDNVLPRTEIGWSEPLYLDYVTGVTSGGVGGTARNHNTRWSARVAGTFFLGSHTAKTGFDYEETSMDLTYSFQSGVNFEDPGLVQRLDDMTWMAVSGYLRGAVSNRIASAFVQDSWLVSERLRLNGGVRWTLQYMLGTSGNVVQQITDEFQPRLGATYQFGKDGESKAYGSYGRFYEQIPLYFPFFYTDNQQNTDIVFYDHDPRGNYAGGDTIHYRDGIFETVPGLQGEYYDEYSLGVEHRIGGDLKVGIRGTYRNLLQVVEDAMDTATGNWFAGNPGSGNLSFLPKFTRQYRALEFTLERNVPEGLNVIASYVLSRTYGNYPGLYSGDFGDGSLDAGNTNLSPSLDAVDQFPNADGVLPNDRTHLVKISGSWAFASGLSLGASFFLQSGTPLNEFGVNVTSSVLPLVPRGSLGRTPTNWDLNIRASYSLLPTAANVRPKLIVDVFHVFSQRAAVLIDQHKYLARDPDTGEQIGLNPTYGQVKLYQPPMSVRLGMEVNF